MKLDEAVMAVIMRLWAGRKRLIKGTTTSPAECPRGAGGQHPKKIGHLRTERARDRPVQAVKKGCGLKYETSQQQQG